MIVGNLSENKVCWNQKKTPHSTESEMLSVREVLWTKWFIDVKSTVPYQLLLPSFHKMEYGVQKLHSARTE